MKSKFKYMVCVNCFTFDHANFIEDAMNGFCMQQTNFPFVCVIVDDASTDGEPEVIQEYLENNFDLNDKSVVRYEETDDYVLTFAQHKTNKNCYFAVLWLKYNHYSIKKNKLPYYAEWQDNAKYIAICEGDDYWIHPQKLQIQIEFLEENKPYTMVCNNTELYSVKQNIVIGNNRCYELDREIDKRDVIIKGGSFISTCSIVYRSQIMINYPDYCKQCWVGDYPLQIMAVMKGKAYYFDDVLSVYRTENSESWCGCQEEKLLSENQINGIQSEIQMLQGFQKDYPEYADFFGMRVMNFIFSKIPNRLEDPKGCLMYVEKFQNEIRHFGLKRRIMVIWMTSRFSKTYFLYSFLRSKLNEILDIRY